jgi:UDP:flavonoid glycosyltransferase YjiC (YdhE family)
MRVLITMPPLCGHFFPAVPLAWALRAAGHEVLVATPRNFASTVTEAGLPVADGLLPAVEWEEFMFRDRAGRPLPPPRDPAERREHSGRAWGRLAARVLDGVLAAVDAWRPDLVVADRTEYAGPLAAATYGVPWVEHGWGVADVPAYRPAAARELAPELDRLGIFGLPVPRLVVESGPARLVPADTRRGTERVLMRYVPYGNRALLPSWALEERERPRICLTFGSILPRHGRRDFAGLLRELMAALPEHTGAEVVVAVDDDVAARWQPLPAGVRAAGWMALGAVLPACDLVVHHGGSGSMFNAMVAGLPQLALPQTADQFDNAERLAALGAGLQVVREQQDVTELVGLCQELLTEPGYRKAARDLAAENAEQPAPGAVVDVLERLARPEATEGAR